MTETPSLTVTLIHGTFANGAAWTQESSPLSRELRGTFGATATIDRFEWSGDNSAFARLEAGRQLSKYLGRLKEKFPSAKHFIIAHSHGGNVALYAAQETSVDGIACLATPFIHAAPKEAVLIGAKTIGNGISGLVAFISFIALVFWPVQPGAISKFLIGIGLMFLIRTRTH